MLQNSTIHLKPSILLLLIVALLSANVKVSAQESISMAKYKPQLRLIDSIKAYIANDLGMYVQSNFYDNLEYPVIDSFYTFLYVSRSDRVEKDSASKLPWYFTSDSLATAKAKEMSARGYHTLVYKTAGMTSTLLTPKLLSYPDEAIAFIVFHEVVHQDLLKLGSPIRYNYEEALCDVIANMACVKFAEKTKMIDVHAAEKQRAVFERSYSFLNRERTMLDTMQQQNKPALYKTCNKTISELTADANQFAKNRLDYEVNNAYFLRIDDYATNYFKIKKLFVFSFDFTDIVKRIEALEQK